MKVATERLENSQVVLNIEIDQGVVDRGLNRAYQRLNSRLIIPGFRKGKAPRAIVERHVGRPTLLQEALEIIVPEIYQQAIAESGIKPVGEPNFDVVQAEPLTLKATVDVEPEVELGDYQSVRVTREESALDPKLVDSTLETLQRQNAEQIPVERPAKLGDVCTIDIKGTVEEEVVLDREGLEYELEADSSAPAPGFAAELVGLSVGDRKEFTLTLPEDHAQEELRGKPVKFEVELKGVKEVQLPAIDDELAKTTGEAETLEGLREKVRERLQARLDADAKAKHEGDVVKAVVERAKVEIPASMINAEINSFVNRTASQFGSPVAQRQFLESLRGRGQQLREDLAPGATQSIKTQLVLAALAVAEGIEATDDEIDHDIEQIALVSEEADAERIRTAGQRPEIRASLATEIRRRKAVERLVEIASQADAPTPPATPTAAESSSAEGEFPASAATAAGAEAEPAVEATAARSRKQGEAKAAQGENESPEAEPEPATSPSTASRAGGE